MRACCLCKKDVLLYFRVCPECLHKINNDIHIGQPYKCPVCDGSGSVNIVYAMQDNNGSVNASACRSCNGSGIIWG